MEKHYNRKKFKFQQRKTTTEKNKIGCRNYFSLTLLPTATENYFFSYNRTTTRISVAHGCSFFDKIITTDFFTFFRLRLPKFYNWNAVFGWTFYQPKKWISVLTFRWRIMTIFSGHHQIQIELNSSLFKILVRPPLVCILYGTYYMRHFVWAQSRSLDARLWNLDPGTFQRNDFTVHLLFWIKISDMQIVLIQSTFED